MTPNSRLRFSAINELISLDIILLYMYFHNHSLKYLLLLYRIRITYTQPSFLRTIGILILVVVIVPSITSNDSSIGKAAGTIIPFTITTRH